MIVSASRRTDIPAFYADWFVNRVREGFVLVRNPVSPHRISRVSLSPEVVDCIVFWTSDPAPMTGRLGELSSYEYYFQVTLTGYGRDVEPRVPDKREALIPAFLELSHAIGPERVIWRYDPILISEKYSPEYHMRAFRSIAEALEGATQRCVISFVDAYARNRESLARLGCRDLSDGELRSLAHELSEEARRHGMTMSSCAEEIDLSACGIEHGSCVDRALIERLTGHPLKVGADPSQRPRCGCCASVEVGAYNTCRHGCEYCYATYSAEAVSRACREYDPTSPLLCSRVGPDDVITERHMVSLAERQLPLW